MFPLSFPLSALDEHPATRVLDPFCGRGTTLYASRLRGVESTGIDTNPVAVALSMAKTTTTTPDRVATLARRLIEQNEKAAVPTGEFWQWCFHPRTLADLCRLRAGLMHRRGADAVMLRATVLGVLHGPRTRTRPSYLSNQMPRTFATKPDYSVRYWSRRGLRPEPVDAVDLIRRRAAHVLAAVPPSVSASVHHGSAAVVLRRLRQKFDLVVTSPPYFGMRTYLPDQWLRAWFLGGPDTVVYTAPSTLTSVDGTRFLDGLAEIWAATAQRCRAGARLVVRFGSLPSLRVDPAALLGESLAQADAGWRLQEIRSAGSPALGRRQSDQFGKAGGHIDEIDVTAVLQDT